MATLATISHWQFLLQTADSPITLHSIEEVYSVSNVGHTNQIVDVTNFDSAPGTREYIPGLAEGDEVTVECNYVPTATYQKLAMTASDLAANRSAKLVYTGSSPNRSFAFTAACTGWSVAPASTERNTIRFTYKISGAITRLP